MITTSFQRKAIVTAVSGVLTAGLASGAYAADLATADNAYPESGNNFFLGAPLTNVRMLSNNGTTLENTVTGRLNYFDAADASLGSSVTSADSNATAATVVDISVTVGAPAGVDYAVFTVDTSASSDTIGGFGSLFGYVDTNGNLVGDDGAAAFATEADAIAHAQANNGRLTIDSLYTGINITDARLDQGGASPGVVYVTFNANPKIAGAGDGTIPINGAGVVAADYVEIKDSTIPPAAVIKTISNGGGGTPGQFLGANQKAFIEGTLPTNEPQPPGTPFAGPISSVGTGANLDDGAGNGPSIVASFAPPLPLDPPAYATAGQVAMGIGSAAALYDGGAASVTLRIRMNEEVANNGAWNDANDVSSNSSATFAGFSLAPDADGLLTILSVNANVTGANLFFIDPDTGNVTYGTERDLATPFAVTVTSDPTPASRIALKLDPGVTLDADLTEEQAVAGVVQAPQLITQDDDADGWVDGGILNFRQNLTVPFPAGSNLGLVSYTGAPDPVLLIANVAAGANAPEVLLDLTNKDVPNPDGTAPLAASNDFNGDGTVDMADADLVIGENFNSGVDNTLDTPPGDAGPPFQAFVGTDDLTNAAPTTALTYANAYDSQTGLNLAVNTGPVKFSEDGAAPNVQSVEWTKTGTIACDASTDVDIGVLTINASEPVKPVPGIADNTKDTINEFLLGGLTPDLINDAACAPADTELPVVQIDIGGSNPPAGLGALPEQILLSNLPRSVLLTDLTLGPTGGAVDLVPELPLFVNPALGANVTEPDPVGPAVDYTNTDDPEVEPILVDGEWTHIVVHFDQDVFPPTGQTAADLDKVFTVRALAGWDASGSNTDNPTEVFQFVIAGADVGIGTAGVFGAPTTVTLKLPGGNKLPEDTFKVWVDYQGATTDEVDAGALNFIQNALGSPALVDGGRQFDDLVPPANDVPIVGTFTGDIFSPTPPGPQYAATVDDTDTGSSAEFDAPFIGLGGREDDQRRLFTQTVKGAVTNGGEKAFEGTAVRADLVRMEISTGLPTIERKAVVKDGWIEVRQGSNSEYSDEGPVDGDDNYQDENNWVNVALLNKAVTGADFDKWAQSLQNIADELEEYQSALANNKDSKTTDRLYSDWQKAQIAHDRVYQLNPNDSDDYLPGYVQITSGDGKGATDTAIGETEYNFNTAQANGNASYGRTATLLKTLSNNEKNGTSYYPVWIHMDTGEIRDASSAGRDYGPTLPDPNPPAAPPIVPVVSAEDYSNNVRNGQLAIVSPILGESASETMLFEILDTAYATVDGDGNYKVTVSQDEASFDAKSTGLSLQPDHLDACILIKVKNTTRDSPQSGDWLQANMCEDSFDSYTPFTSDLARDGTPTILDIEVDNISRTRYIDDSDWFLAPIGGTPARDASEPVDLPWFFIQTRPGDGATVTLWGKDGGFGDAVATLGLNQEKEAEVQLAFELGDANDNTEVGELNLRPGSALAIVGDGQKRFFSPTNVTGAPTEGNMTNNSTGNHMLFVPVTGGPQDAFLAADAWHLVTFNARDKMIVDIVTANPAIDAMIIFQNPVSDGTSGRDDAGDDRLDGDVDTFVWFQGETPPDYELGDIFGAFIHVDADVDPFNIDIP